MRFISTSLFFVSLVSLSTLTTTFAAPVKWDDSALERRTNPVKVAGHTIHKGTQLSPATHEKSTVWRVAKTDNQNTPGHVIKHYHNGLTVKDHEVAGLKAAGQYVAHDDHHVVMHEVPGKTLAQVAAGMNKDDRRAYVNKMKPHVAAKVDHYVKNHGILHSDINMNNVVVHPTKENHVDLVDWEHHTVVPKTHDASKEIDKALNYWDSTQTPPGI